MSYWSGGAAQGVVQEQSGPVPDSGESLARVRGAA